MLLPYLMNSRYCEVELFHLQNEKGGCRRPSFFTNLAQSIFALST